MRLRFLPFFVALLLCAFSAAAQTVDESRSSVSIEDNSAVVSLVFTAENDQRALPVSVELLDTNGAVRSRSPLRSASVRSGAQTLEFRLPVGDILAVKSEDIAWYRLRYTIGSASGIMSLSQLIRDLFELRVIAGEHLFSGTTYRVRIRAVQPFTGEPGAGVQVAANVTFGPEGERAGKLTLNGTGVTDRDGFASLDLAIPADAKLDDEGTIKVVGRRNGIIREAEEDLRGDTYDVRFLSLTDKPIYQPEQMLNVRGILMKGSDTKTVLSDTELEFRISDEDDTVLYREKVRTSPFGIASINWQVPASAKLGDYRIEVRDGSGEQVGGIRVKVSRYDLPNFAVQAKPDKPYYLPSEKEASVAINADYLFGKPVEKGKVRVVEETSRDWNWKEQKYDINEGQIREGETDANGQFTAKFDLAEFHDDLKDSDWRKYDDIHFAAYFTDLSTNRTEQRRFDIRVTNEPIHVYVLNDYRTQNPTLPVTIYVSTFYADGTAAKCDLDVKASIEDEDKFRTIGHLTTNEYGVGKLIMPRPKIGDPDDDLDFRLVATDRAGRNGTAKETVNFDEDEDEIQVTTDRSIYKPGETMNVSVAATKKSGPVYIDVISGWSVVDSRFAILKGGKARLQLPYSEAFKGELKVAAFAELDDDEMISASRRVIFPARQGIAVDASFDKAVYKPGEDATVKYSVVDSLGHALESALGVVVLDRAVEERARTDADFGGYWRNYYGWIGYGDGIGKINVKDLNELDLTKPISEELQLTSEVILRHSYYDPKIFHSRSYFDEAKSIFGTAISAQFKPIDAALNEAYWGENYKHPTDDASLNAILARHNEDFRKLKDPWGTAYRAKFSVDKARDVVSAISAGPDKQFDTRDDFTAFTAGFDYFTPIGKAIDTVVKNYNAHTGRFIRDEMTLLHELGMPSLIDRFGRPYRLLFETVGRNYRIRISSSGSDGKFEKYYQSGDDFDVWTNSMDYFVGIEARIAAIQQKLTKAPTNEAEFRTSLKEGGVDLDALRDGWGRPYYVIIERRSRYWDKVTIESVRNYGDNKKTDRRVVTPVTQQTIQFMIRSSGVDGKIGTYDDLTMMNVVHVLSEQTKDDVQPVPVIKPAAHYKDGLGAISGMVTDPNGAIIPGAVVTATNGSSGVSSSADASDDGRYVIGNLSAGTYIVKASAPSFKNSVIQNVPVTAGKTLQVDIRLEVSSTINVVEVAGGSETMQTDTTDSKIQTNITAMTITALPKGSASSSFLKLGPNRSATEQASSTPRLREYFPETLVWQPEMVTGADGKAELKFKMADSITTWKMYTIASTRDGKIGVAEKEVTAFQAFFADLDPPKFLTEGDEIFLPTQIRNYTDKRQKVDVTMDRAAWFSMLTPEKQQIEVDSNASKNAVFGFKAITPIKAGKQRVTAIAEADSDAIEKPVTVRPDGQEIVRTDSRFAAGTQTIGLAFPANALPHTQRAELKIFPNLYSHIADSVGGLLHRPYGCGEQTISSTYPNLMILKFVKPETSIAKKARTFLQKGYERLLGYQVADGGFTYWGGKDKSNIALTAYAIRFLTDARSQILVDDDVVKRASDWLLKQQRADGSWSERYVWEKQEDLERTKMLTTYIARSLAMNKDSDKTALNKALEYLRKRNGEIDEPYSLALYGLASLDAGDLGAAEAVVKRLEGMAISEGDGVYWKLETNTPFYGWGTAGRIETTALVTNLLIRISTSAPSPQREQLIGKGTIFLLKNKDRYGVWYSTQTTINVLDAFLAAIGNEKTTDAQQIRVTLNGQPLPVIDVAADRFEPVVLDLTDKIDPAANTIEVNSTSNGPMMSQTVATHYIDWKDADVSGRTVNQSRALKLEYQCDKTSAAIMQEVNCSVKAERIGFQGYGMLLAEIGTPPGADVSRESLEKAVDSDWSISRYDILPDRIVVYMWSKAGGTSFNFKFRPRYAINAQTPSSIVYDYYNPEAQASTAPIRFTVK